SGGEGCAFGEGAGGREGRGLGRGAVAHRAGDGVVGGVLDDEGDRRGLHVFAEGGGDGRGRGDVGCAGGGGLGGDRRRGDVGGCERRTEIGGERIAGGVFH